MRVISSAQGWFGVEYQALFLDEGKKAELSRSVLEWENMVVVVSSHIYKYLCFLTHFTRYRTFLLRFPTLCEKTLSMVAFTSYTIENVEMLNSRALHGAQFWDPLHSTPFGRIHIHPYPDFSVENSPYPPYPFLGRKLPFSIDIPTSTLKNLWLYAPCINKPLFHTVRKE